MRLRLEEPFEQAAAAFPSRIAIADPGRGLDVRYDRLNDLADSLAADLTRFGAGHGQRVGIYAPKSIPTLAAILATLKAGAAYVPVDTQAPSRRALEILTDCDVRAIVADPRLAETLRTAWGRDLRLLESHAVSELSKLGGEIVLLGRDDGQSSSIEELAYVLYTSGSTGRPKGVMHTHSSARSFVDWCMDVFEPTPEDRFSSHAPFHFDLSILDIYVPLGRGARIVLIAEEAGKNPLSLAPLIAEHRISVWYSTPSVLRLLIEHGGLERYDASGLRHVLFAGEVFPPGQLRQLQRAWPDRRYFNLYGPTETNVCTYFEIVGEVPPNRVDPYPIGKPIPPDDTLVLGSLGPAPRGEEGELLVRGGTVMAGYWNRPELDAVAFHVDDQNRKWYRTGDIVKENQDGDYVFLGRRDSMIKRRGYRVELGEIEAALHGHPDVREAAVVSIPDAAQGVHVRAFVCWTGSQPPSMIVLKRFCAENLPLYMVPDSFTFVEQLPKTSTDKTDYVRLKEWDA
ncbi:MAG TPA: amino acid adenylation domain-containing protein [Gemmatimonadota bacterium]|nr:amino acid adenylation domain-containing protein [Gemmatimonadota bacterium]